MFDYWVAKRQRRGKPIMRRLQVPTALTDTSPYNVFRPREKIQRPQTRRRRENDVQGFEKMRQLRRNIDAARQILEVVLRRERRKRDMVLCELEAQALAVAARHEPRAALEGLEQEVLGAQRLRQKEQEREREPKGPQDQPPGGFGVDFSRKHDGTYSFGRGHGGGGGGGVGGGGGGAAGKKRKRDGRPRAPLSAAELVYQPPPQPPEVEMLFAQPLTIDMLEGIDAPFGGLGLFCRPRIGRGGRLVFDRAHPLTREPYTSDGRQGGAGAGGAGAGDAAGAAAVKGEPPAGGAGGAEEQQLLPAGGGVQAGLPSSTNLLGGGAGGGEGGGEDGGADGMMGAGAPGGAGL